MVLHGYEATWKRCGLSHPRATNVTLISQILWNYFRELTPITELSNGWMDALFKHFSFVLPAALFSSSLLSLCPSHISSMDIFALLLIHSQWTATSRSVHAYISLLADGRSYIYERAPAKCYVCTNLHRDLSDVHKKQELYEITVWKTSRSGTGSRTNKGK